MIFNGIKKDYLRVNRELFRPPTPPIEFQTRPLAKGGERVRKRRMTGMELPVPITIRSEQRIETLKEDLSNWLVHNEAKKLSFTDTPDRYYLARYQGMELREYPHYAKGTLMFYLPVAYRFGKDKTINVTTTQQQHEITGQESTPWTLEVTFSENRNRFEFWAGDNYLRLNYNFITGDKLIVEYTGRKVRLRDLDLRRTVSMSSHFEELGPGPVSMRASHPCTLTYTERYY
ncbi:distal tail protein Dit [Bacillus phage BCASJ1c]|uniref:50 n=1 Tax=Bacillus phage BCASJ1c TaxID=294382 RepID=Q5YA60_9CAUD|nr:distal tail protein Dit [Bacillus phage BCASJ1c]AAU85097.1 50 [Bacillus phage BCASJ1c]